MDGIQAWVALPDEREETDPGFWHYPSQALPVFDGDGIAGRLIAGRLAGVESPVKVDSPQFYVHWQLRAGSRTTLPAEYSERAVYVARGDVEVAGQRIEVGSMRSEEHTSELQSLMRISYAVFCLKKNTK